MNGDGKLDLVTTDADINAVSVLLGNGIGTLGPRTDFPTGAIPAAVAIGDVNGDGKPDLATADAGADAVSVLLGNGTGFFGAKTDFGTGTAPYSVAIGDVSGDGKPDLVTTNYFVNTVSVLLGNGAGVFGAKTDFPTGAYPHWVAIGDVSGDGKPDLVTVNTGDNTVSVLLGNGAGSFGAKTDFPTGSNPNSVAIGDVSGDGKLDVVTPNLDDGTVSVLLGTGTGSFGAKTDFPTGGGPISVAIGDVNGDGTPDLVTANYFANTVSVLPGIGAGSFGANSDFPVGASPYSVAIGDVNADGRTDVIAANYDDDTVSLLLGDGAGSLGAKTDFPTGLSPYSLASGDLNGDSRTDVVTADPSADAVSVLLSLEPTQLALSLSPPLPLPATSFIYTASISVPSPGSGTPTGTVSFFDGQTLLGTATLASGQASLGEVNPQLIGHTITAAYSGDTKFLGALGQASMPTSMAPTIASITDVANDQGGRVVLRWYASPLDRAPYGPITQYRIWRQVPGAFATQSLASGTRHLADLSLGSPEVGALRTTRTSTQIFFWEYLATQIPGGYPGYSYLAATAADSVAGSFPETVYMVEADEYDGLYWSSAPDSGYSVDNLPPAAVTSFTGTYSAGTAFLHWDVSTASDFGAYLLYRGATSDFTPGPGNLVVSQPDTGYVDDAPMPYYKLAAEDVHGNVGPYTLLQLPGAVGVGGPAEFAFALEGARPNPAVGRKLQVRFVLPRAERAELELLDVTGRRVEEREVGSLGPGPHEVDLDMGRRLAPGIYLVRLTQGHRSRTTRVAVLN